MEISNLELITLLLAIYAAVVSTALVIIERKRDKRKILVTCTIAMGPTIEGPVLKLVSITAVNDGHRPVEIISAGFYLSNGMEFIPWGDGRKYLSLPKKISDGESVQSLFYYSDLIKALKEQQKKESGVIVKSAFVRDSQGNEYKAKPPRTLRDM